MSLEWAVGTIWDADITLWGRLYLSEDTWKNVELLAECEDVTVAEILSRVIRTACAKLEGGGL